MSKLTFLSKLKFSGSAKSGKRAESITRVVLLLGLLLALNVIGNFIYTQIDLTEDKRYTITKETKNLIKNLDDIVTVEVYLEGDFPALFKRLQNNVRELLERLHGYSDFLQFNFINPLEGSPAEIKQMQQNLRQVGIVPVNLQVGSAGESKSQLIYPFALVTYKTRTPTRVDLLENRIAGASQEEIINNSINLLEYKFANAIQHIQFKTPPLIAFSTGHGELDSLQLADLTNTLSGHYDLMPLNIGQDGRPTINALRPRKDSTVATGFRLDTTKVDLLVIAKPRRPFSEQEKFEIDQYIMDGGKVLWLIDPLNVESDSLIYNKVYVPSDYTLNLEDQLAKYGVRVNPNIVVDLNCSRIPLVTGMMGDKPQIDLKPWTYYPVAFSKEGKHPIVKSLDGVDMRYPGSIDTLKTKTNVKKTILLSSSNHSRVQYSPVRLSFQLADVDVQPEKYNKPFQPLAVALEGQFYSVFNNRVPPAADSMLRAMGTPFKGVSKNTKMIVVSDGDVARNDIDVRNNPPQAMELGYNRFEKYTYGNKDFVLNSIEFLLDNRGIIAARTKDFKLRLMDKIRLKEERTYWQVVNVVAPVVLLTIFGLVYAWWRRRKYEK